MATPREKLGAAVRALRLEAGLTQWDVAAALGYATAQLVSNWERGVCTPPLAALPKLSELLDVKPEQMVNMVCDARADDLELERAQMLARVATRRRGRRA